VSRLSVLEQELDELRKDTVSSFQAARKSLDASQKDLAALKEQVARLEKEVAELRRRQRTVTRKVEPARTATASIRLVNGYLEPVQIVVKGTPYRLAPGETRLLRGQAPGTFIYEVVGVQEPVERVLGAYETFTIRIRAQP
jgi:hypothetical protein